MSAGKQTQAQIDANAMRLQRLEMQMQAANARRQDDGDEEDEVVYHELPPEPQYNQVDQQQILIDQLTRQVTERVASNLQAHQSVSNGIENRMKRLVDEFPAIQEDDSSLTVRARDEYARISRENPSLNEADKYELAVKSAAVQIGARPVNLQFDPNQDFTLSSSGHNPARRRTTGSGSRLTNKVVQNAMALGINVDPKTVDGKRNLEELNEYSARFNADVDEEHLRFR